MIQVINRALNILEILAQEPDKRIRIIRNCYCCRIKRGNLRQYPKNACISQLCRTIRHKKGYKLGYMIYQLTRDNSYNTELVNAAKVAMDNLRDNINETVILSVIKGDKRIFTERITMYA